MCSSSHHRGTSTPTRRNDAPAPPIHFNRLHLPHPQTRRAFKRLPIRHPYNQYGNYNPNVSLRFLLDCTHSHLAYRSDLLSGYNAGMDSYHQQCGAHPRCQHGSDILSSDRDSSHGWTIHHVQPQEATVNQVEVSRSPHTRHSKRASVNNAPLSAATSLHRHGAHSDSCLNVCPTLGRIPDRTAPRLRARLLLSLYCCFSLW